MAIKRKVFTRPGKNYNSIEESLYRRQIDEAFDDIIQDVRRSVDTSDQRSSLAVKRNVFLLKAKGMTKL